VYRSEAKLFTVSPYVRFGTCSLFLCILVTFVAYNDVSTVSPRHRNLEDFPFRFVRDANRHNCVARSLLFWCVKRRRWLSTFREPTSPIFKGRFHPFTGHEDP